MIYANTLDTMDMTLFLSLFLKTRLIVQNVVLNVKVLVYFKRINWKLN